MIEFIDEVLDPSLQPDENPRYTIKDNDGKVIQDDVQIELKTPIVQKGTPLNRKFFLDVGFHKGMILMWSGSIETIPAGWNLCDGTNGTPDLRNRFIVGAGSKYSVASTGGSDNVTLTEAQMPSHTHTATTTIEEDGLHTHKYTGYAYHTNHGGTAHTGSPYEPTNKTTESSGSHTHVATTTLEATGSSEAHENRPPYYALAYIMKI